MSKQYLKCDACHGSGAIDEDTGAPSSWGNMAATECLTCDGMGRWVNPEHVAKMRHHLNELLDSEPFLAELENANYHSAADFLEELTRVEWG